MNSDRIKIGSKVKYRRIDTQEEKTISIILSVETEIPVSGNGAYYPIRTKTEVIPPDYSKNQITSKSAFAKAIINHVSGEIIQVISDSNKRYLIKILSVENESR